MEAFYEGEQTARYLNLEEARTQRLCSNYQAFNLPVSAVLCWLEAMREASTGEAEPYWAVETNDWERALLWHLQREGVAIPGVPPAEDVTAPAYVVSTCSSEESSLAHERQHALYHLHPGYAHACRQLFPVTGKMLAAVGRQEEPISTEESVGWPSSQPIPPQHSPAIAQAIAYELGKLRGYHPRVWTDEWQAYLSVPLKCLDEAEFGNKAKDEVRQAAALLREWSQRAWQEVQRTELTSTAVA